MHQRPVYSLGLRMVSARHQAEDLAQDVFLQLYRSLAALESEDHLSFWLRRVTMHRAIDRLRRERRYAAMPLADAEIVASDSADADPLLQRPLPGLLAEVALA